MRRHYNQGITLNNVKDSNSREYQMGKYQQRFMSKYFFTLFLNDSKNLSSNQNIRKNQVL